MSFQYLRGKTAKSKFVLTKTHPECKRLTSCFLPAHFLMNESYTSNTSYVTYLKQLGRMDIRPLPANFCAPVRPVYLPAPAETNTTNIHRVMLLPASQQEYIRTISKTICANSTFTYHCTELVPNAHIRLHDTPYISLHYLRRSWESPKKLTRSQ